MVQLDVPDEEVDELKNSPVCDEGYFQCNSELCLDKKWTCDGRNDCGEWEDEIGCGKLIEYSYSMHGGLHFLSLKST